jgi:hypothetical protein
MPETQLPAIMAIAIPLAITINTRIGKYSARKASVGMKQSVSVFKPKVKAQYQFIHVQRKK